MTDGPSLKPDLGRFGVWTSDHRSHRSRPSRSRSSATARCGSAGRPAADLNYVEPILEQTETLQVATGIVNVWTRRGRAGRRSPTTASRRPIPAGSCSASASGTPSTPRSTASPTTCWSSTSTRSTPRRCRPAGGSSPRSGRRCCKLSAQRSAGAHPYLTTPEHTGSGPRIDRPTVFLAPEHKVVLTDRRRRGPRDRPRDRRLLPEPVATT